MGVPCGMVGGTRRRGAKSYNSSLNPTSRHPLPDAVNGRMQEIDMPVIDRIQAEVEGHPVVLFMKGTPQFPMCGFSSRTVQALKAAGAQTPYGQRAARSPKSAPTCRAIPTGRRSRSCSSTANSSAAATSPWNCSKPASWPAWSPKRRRPHERGVGRRHAGASTALTDRVVLVTGAHGGLGEAAAMACAQAGATVVLLGRKVPKLNRTLRCA